MILSEHYKKRLIELAGVFVESKYPHDRLIKQNNKYTYPKIPVQNIFLQPLGIIDREKNTIADNIISSGKFKQIAKIIDVDLSKIIPTQKNVTAYNLASAYSSIELPELLETNGNFYVIDGHHRIANAILDGHKTIEAYALHID